MALRVLDLDASHAGDALDLCARAGTRPEQAQAQHRDRAAWLQEVLQEWDPCGKLAYANGRATGLVLDLPAALFAGRSLCRAYQDRPVEFPAAWADRNVVVTLCLWALSARQGVGGGSEGSSTSRSGAAASAAGRAARSASWCTPQRKRPTGRPDRLSSTLRSDSRRRKRARRPLGSGRAAGSPRPR